MRGRKDLLRGIHRRKTGNQPGGPAAAQEGGGQQQLVPTVSGGNSAIEVTGPSASGWAGGLLAVGYKANRAVVSWPSLCQIVHQMFKATVHSVLMGVERLVCTVELLTSS